MARENALLTVAQAAKRLGVSPNTIRAWADRGAIPVVRLPSGHRRFEPRAIDSVREHVPADDSYEAAREAWIAAGERWARTHRTKLTPEERERGLAALAEMTRIAQELAARNGNDVDIDSVELVRRMREERTEELLRAVDGR
jgi:excisionase family DNA binding protein